MKKYIKLFRKILQRADDSSRNEGILRKLCTENPTSIIKSIDLNRAYLGNKVFIHNNVHLDQVYIGDYSYISNNTSLVNVEIGKYCSIGPHVQIGLASHPTKVFVSTYPGFYSDLNSGCVESFQEKKIFDDSIPKTLIKNDVWIGSNVIIPGGIRVENGAIVAAGSVVVKDVPPFSIVGGNPARIIRKRFTDEQIEILSNRKWWDWSIDKIIKNLVYFSEIERFTEILKRFDAES